MQRKKTTIAKPPKGMLTIEEVAARFNKSKQAIKLYIAGGVKRNNFLVPDARVNNRPYFKPSTVARYIATLRAPGAPSHYSYERADGKYVYVRQRSSGNLFRAPFRMIKGRIVFGDFKPVKGT